MALKISLTVSALAIMGTREIILEQNTSGCFGKEEKEKNILWKGVWPLLAVNLLLHLPTQY